MSLKDYDFFNNQFTLQYYLEQNKLPNIINYCFDNKLDINFIGFIGAKIEDCHYIITKCHRIIIIETLTIDSLNHQIYDFRNEPSFLEYSIYHDIQIKISKSYNLSILEEYLGNKLPCLLQNTISSSIPCAYDKFLSDTFVNNTFYSNKGYNKDIDYSNLRILHITGYPNILSVIKNYETLIYENSNYTKPNTIMLTSSLINPNLKNYICKVNLPLYLPPNLECLDLAGMFNLPLTYVPTLSVSYTKCNYNLPFPNDLFIHTKLKKVVLGVFDHCIDHLPDTVTTLHLGSDFKQIIKKLPSMLKELNLSSYDQILNPHIIPHSITYIDFGYQYSHNISPIIQQLPNLKHLEIPMYYKYKLCVLPMLKVLVMRFYNIYIGKNILPNTLEKLYFLGGYGDDLYNIETFANCSNLVELTCGFSGIQSDELFECTNLDEFWCEKGLIKKN